MKVLIIHNFYGSSAPSGENQVFEAEKTLLCTRGNDVAEITRHSDEIRTKGVAGAIQGAVSTPWNPFMARTTKKRVVQFQPDIVHVHNTFPLLSPSIFHAIGQRAARVLTLHNYRLYCPAAIPMRDGHVCTDCLSKQSVWPAIRHGCYRNSRLATLPLATSVALHRTLGTWINHVDAFIALTEFQREYMIDAGLPAGLVHVKPNFYSGNPPPIPWQERKQIIVFVGRLTAEKGVKTLVRAWQMWGADAPELRIVGDGNLKPELMRMAEGLPVRFMGQLSNVAAQQEIATAQLLILPSECFETFGLVLGEAFASGTPAAVSNLGPLPSIVRHGINGVVFSPADPPSLLKEVSTAWQTPGQLEKLAQGARSEFEEKYTESVNYKTLMSIYQQAIDVSRSRV